MSGPLYNVAHEFAEAKQATDAAQDSVADEPQASVAEDHPDLEKQEPEDEKDTYVHGLKLFFVFVGMSLSVFVIILDQTILIPAIPIIASDFNAINQIGWISASYFITQCSSLLLWGQALAFFDPKLPLILSIGIFEIGSLIAAVAHNFTTLIIGRAIAGLGGAAILVAVMSISSQVIELKRRPIFFGLFGIIFILGSSLGPIIGGGFTESVTWRWCFYINLPIGGLSMAVISFLIPSLHPTAKIDENPHFVLRKLRGVFGDRPALAHNSLIGRVTGLDWVATIILLGGVVSLTLALTDGGGNGWSTTPVIVGFTVAGVCLILLILWEVYVMGDRGMVPIKLTKYRSVWGSSGVAFARMINSLVILTYLPTYLQATRHESALHSAVSTLPYAIGMAIFGLMGSVVVQKTGRFKWALILGMAMAAIGAGLLYTLGPDTPYSRVAGFQIIACAGAGLVQMNAVLAAQAEMDARGLKAYIPQVSALVSLFQTLGGSLGGSIGGAVLTTGVRQHAASLPADVIESLLASVETIWKLPPEMQQIAINAYAKGADNTFLVGVPAAGLGVLFALLCVDRNIKGKKYH